MRARLLFLLASAIVTSPLAAQGALLARADAPVETLYRLRLTSAWPELRLSPECVNGGEEVLSGNLHWIGSGLYRGEFSRQTTIRFCGAHGSVADACSATLTGSGTVLAEGTVLAPSGNRAGNLVELRWTPDSTTVATLSGDCSEDFGDQLRKLYATATHSVELVLPAGDRRPERQRVEDYGWVVEIW
jgi:hypothetical protein